jgi:5-methylcytosine-specific restriction endonuclease McrA
MKKRRRRFLYKSLKERFFVEQAGKCFYCNRDCIPTYGKRFKKNEIQPDNLFTLDHVCPKNIGGKLSYNNCVGACRKCNLLKKSKSLQNFKKKFTIHASATESIDPDMMLFPEKWWRDWVRRAKTEIVGVVISFFQSNPSAEKEILKNWKR